MKKLLLGFTVGAITGAVAYNKMHKNKLPEKALESVQEKVKKM